MSVLQHHADHGFERDHLEAALNLIEFRVREPPRGGYGLGVMLSVLPRWVHYGYVNCAAPSVPCPLGCDTWGVWCRYWWQRPCRRLLLRGLAGEAA